MRAWGLCVALCATGCFAVADLDRFEAASAPPNAADDPRLPSDLALTLKGMAPHLDQRIELRVIDASNIIQSRILVEPVDEPSTVTLSIHVPAGIPVDNGPYRLDFYADVSRDGTFEGLQPPGVDPLYRDHAWRIAPLVDYPAGTFPHVANVVQVVFTHNKLFTDINEWPEGHPAPPQDTGVDVVLHGAASKLGPFAGHLLQVRVVEAHTGHVVGVYRKPQIPADDFDGRIPGVVEPGESYEVQAYVDANGDDAYEDPSSGGDLAWTSSVVADQRPDGAGGVVGIEIDLDPASGSGAIEPAPP